MERKSLVAGHLAKYRALCEDYINTCKKLFCIKKRLMSINKRPSADIMIIKMILITISNLLFNFVTTYIFFQ